MKCFGIVDDEEVARINKKIEERVRHNEEVCRAWRNRKGWMVLGVKRLRAQPIMAPHTPKKHGRRIFCIASTAALRIRVIKAFKRFCAKCRKCYEAWAKGMFQ